MNQTLESRIDFIRAQIKSGEYTSPSRECTVIIETSFRELYRRSIGLLTGPDRIKVNQTEIQIGGGTKTLDDFTMGQLVALYRNSGFLKSWSTATGNELRGITMINLDEMVRLRNSLHHGLQEATRNEAELLFQCVQSILETFGILSLEAVTADAPPLVPPAKSREKSSVGEASAYLPNRAPEVNRLHLQARNIEPFDIALLAAATKDSGSGPLVVVDLGSADGYVTKSRFAADTYSHVLGIDRNPQMVHEANASLQPGSKFTFVHADLEDGGLETAIETFLAENNLHSVDLIFSALTLHHLANPIKLLRACRYVLGDAGVVVLRGSDDGSKIAWPDLENNVARIIELTLGSSGVSDRLNGRKLYTQLYRAGFRSIDTMHDVQDTAGRSPRERGLMFQDSFAYRADYMARRAENEPGNVQLARDLAEMRERLDELEFDFEAESFYYSEMAYAAFARIS
ncbi:MAG: trxB2 [Glaciihabitans sp.]|nr:trxB2 [Glaciihabitans sp.]